MNYSKLFSDLNDHMGTKISFCQRLSTIPATANDRNDREIAGIESSAITTS